MMILGVALRRIRLVEVEQLMLTLKSTLKYILKGNKIKSRVRVKWKK